MANMTLKWNFYRQWILALFFSEPSHDELYAPPTRLTSKPGAGHHMIPALDFTLQITSASLQASGVTLLIPHQHEPWAVVSKMRCPSLRAVILPDLENIRRTGHSKHLL